MILYKYRGNSAYTDRIFLEGKVWLANPVNLNDPSECTLHSLDPDWVAEQVKEMKSAQVLGFLVGIPGSPRHPLASEFAAKLNGIIEFEGKYQAFRTMYENSFATKLSVPEHTFEQIEDQLKNIGIFSLSECADDPLMWSHYGQGHEGVCLGFEIADGMPISDRDRFIRVTYSDQIPRMNRGFQQEIVFFIDEEGKREAMGWIPLTDETLRAALSTKPVCWQYEKEWRYFEIKSGSYPYPGPLVEIVFGYRCTPERRKHYRQLTTSNLSNDVRLYEIRRIPNSSAFERVFLGVGTSTQITPTKIARSLLVDDETSVRDKYPAIQEQFDFGRYAQLLPAINEALKQDPDSSTLWRTKGVVLGHMLQHAEALGCFERSSALNPAFFSAWYHRGVACTEVRRYQEAILAYSEALKLRPVDASSWYNLGIVHAHLGHNSEARIALLAAEKAGHPRARDILNDLGLAPPE